MNRIEGGPASLVFTGAGTKTFFWDGIGTIHISVTDGAGVAVTLQYRHGSADAWKNFESVTITGNGTLKAQSMPTSDAYELGITTNGAAKVLVGKTIA